MLHCSKIHAAVIAVGTLAIFSAPSSVSAQSLSGHYWNAPAGTTTSIAQAQAFMLTNSADGTFTSQQSTLEGSGYNGSDLGTATDFLGADGASFQGTDKGMSDGLFDMKGFLTVGSTNTYNFSTYSDDGSAIFIDGQEIVDNDGVHGPQSAFGSDFLTAGMHTIDVVYYNWQFAGGAGGATMYANFGGGTLSPVPEASTAGLFSLTILAMASILFYKRRSSAV